MARLGFTGNNCQGLAVDSERGIATLLFKLLKLLSLTLARGLLYFQSDCHAGKRSERVGT